MKLFRKSSYRLKVATNYLLEILLKTEIYWCDEALDGCQYLANICSFYKNLYLSKSHIMFMPDFWHYAALPRTNIKSFQS